MGQRQHPDDLAAPTFHEVMASVAEAFLDHRLPAGKMKEGCVRPRFDEAVPGRIAAVSAVTLDAVGRLGGHPSPPSSTETTLAMRSHWKSRSRARRRPSRSEELRDGKEGVRKSRY